MDIPLGIGEKILADNIAQELRNILVQDRSLSGICRSVATWHVIAERFYPTFTASYPNKPVACARGCGTCCKSLVCVRPIDAVFVAVHAQNTLSQEQLTRVYQQLVSTPWMCPLLLDDACSVYEARPHLCRSYYSFDAALCKIGKSCDRDQDNPELHQARYHFLLSSWVSGKVAEMTGKFGLQSDQVYLQTALRQIFEDPTVIDRWLDGEPVFLTQSQETEAKAQGQGDAGEGGGDNAAPSPL